MKCLLVVSFIVGLSNGGRFENKLNALRSSIPRTPANEQMVNNMIVRIKNVLVSYMYIESYSEISNSEIQFGFLTNLVVHRFKTKFICP